MHTPRPKTNAYSISHVVSDFEIRSVNYLSTMLVKDLGIKPAIVGDLDLAQISDVSYVSFGGPGYIVKSHEAILHPSNGLVHFDNLAMTDVKTGRLLHAGPQGQYDFWLILKVVPEENQNRGRVWLVCAGFGEWGTSGAASHPARNWKNISKRYGNKPFAVIVRVEQLKDDSSLEVYSSQGQ